MGLYLESGYVNIRWILEQGLPYNFVVGGRGTGKTYTTLEMLIDDMIAFMLMRRTQAQVDIINKPIFNVFKSLNAARGWNIGVQMVSKINAGYYRQEKNDKDELVCTGAPLGYTCALSTLSNMRGFDSSETDLLVYDEFIPEKHAKPIKGEGYAFLNAYETINRNREFTGRKPLQALCLANSDNLSNPIFLELGIVRAADQAKAKGKEIVTDEKRGFGIFFLDKSPISVRKKDTALYKLTAGSDFERMSLGNDFAQEERSRIGSRPLKEYRPIAKVGEICIYKHKARQEYYISTHVSGNPAIYGAGEVDRARFFKVYGWIWDEYMKNNVVFEEYLCEILFTKYLN